MPPPLDGILWTEDDFRSLQASVYAALFSDYELRDAHLDILRRRYPEIRRGYCEGEQVFVRVAADGQVQELPLFDLSGVDLEGSLPFEMPEEPPN